MHRAHENAYKLEADALKERRHLRDAGLNVEILWKCTLTAEHVRMWATLT